MEPLNQIIINHYIKYPKMELTDYFKLIYQHVNGGNHLLKDFELAKKYLLDEYQSIDKNGNQELFEDIGNNLIRINLARFKYEQLNVNQLFDAFVESSNDYHKDIDQMENAFKVLSGLIKEERIPFNISEFETSLTWYRKNDYPIISHSEKYKELYNPHYRIINTRYIDSFTGIKKIIQL